MIVRWCLKVWEASWAVLEAPLSLLGPLERGSLGPLKATVTPLGPSWGRLGAILSHLGAFLVPRGGFLGALLVLLQALGGTLNFQNFLFGLP